MKVFLKIKFPVNIHKIYQLKLSPQFDKAIISQKTCDHLNQIDIFNIINDFKIDHLIIRVDIFKFSDHQIISSRIKTIEIDCIIFQMESMGISQYLDKSLTIRCEKFSGIIDQIFFDDLTLICRREGNMQTIYQSYINSFVNYVPLVTFRSFIVWGKNYDQIVENMKYISTVHQKDDFKILTLGEIYYFLDKNPH